MLRWILEVSFFNDRYDQKRLDQKKVWCSKHCREGQGSKAKMVWTCDEEKRRAN